jgi:predicted permease
LISLTGGALGLLLSAWMVDALMSINPEPLPRFVEVGLNVPVLGFTLLLCVAVGVLFGMAPALSTRGVNVLTALKVEGYGHSPSARPLFRRSLVGAEVACAVVVLVGAGLMLRTLERLRTLDPGFDLSGLLAVAVRPSVDPQVPTTPIARAVLERVRALPMVEDASLTWDLPLTDMWIESSVRIGGADVEPLRVRTHFVAPAFFRTLGIPLIEGRDIAPTDVGPGGRDVVIINRRLARQHFPSGSPLGQVLRRGQRTFEIVGVVGDVRHQSLLESATSFPDVYFSLYQVPQRVFTVVARSSSDPGPLAAAIREVVRQVNPAAPIRRVRTGEDLFAGQIRRQRFLGTLLTVLALLAVALALIGIYGVTAYHVGRQTRQIGIRIALGATRADVLRLVVGGELVTVVLGVLAGILAASGLSRTLATFIHGVSFTDPVTYGLTALLLASTALVACLIPARRAASVDPVTALRAE